MSEDDKKFGEGSEGTFDKENKKSNEFGERAKEESEKFKNSSKKFADDTKKAANEFGEDAKKTANQFSEGAREAFSNVSGENKKILAGILAIFLGGFGIHKFILGYTKEGVIMLAVTIIIGAITCGIASPAVWLIGLIEGIIYLTKTDEEFYATYQAGSKPWF